MPRGAEERFGRRVADGSPADGPQGLPLVVLIGMEEAYAFEVARGVGRHAQLVLVSGMEALVPTTQYRPRVVCLGRADGTGDLDRVLAAFSGSAWDGWTRLLVLEGGQCLAPFQQSIDGNRVYYLARSTPETQDTARLILAAIGSGREAATSPLSLDRFLQPLSVLLARLPAEDDPEDASELIGQAVASIFGCSRSYCLLFDRAEETLWARERSSVAVRLESAAVGLAAYAARTATIVCMKNAEDDTRFDEDADDPEGKGGRHLLAAPVRALNGDVLGIIVMVRDAHLSPFGDDEVRLADSMSRCVAPALEACLMRLGSPGRPGSHRGRQPSPPDRSRLMLDITGGWLGRAAWGLISVVSACLILALLIPIDDYVLCSAMVRATGLVDVAAPSSGLVTSIDAGAGEMVAAGDVVAKLGSEREAADVRRITHEIEAQTLMRLDRPGDRAAEERLLSLRFERDSAAARLLAMSIRAPISGRVASVRLRPGQHVEFGQPVISLAQAGTDISVQILLPAEYAAKARNGRQARLRLAGSPESLYTVTIAKVGSEVFGAEEVRSFLSRRLTDGLDIPGPVVILEARLRSPLSQSENESAPLIDGARGKAEVRLESHRLIAALVPALRGLL